MAWKASDMMISVLLVALMAGLFVSFLSGLNEQYTPTSDYNESNYEVYNQLAAVRNNTEEIRNQVEEVESESGILDVIGAYFSSAYEAFRLTKNSYDTLEVITENSVEQANLGVNADLVRGVVITIILIVIIVGIIMSTLLKRES